MRLPALSGRFQENGGTYYIAIVAIHALALLLLVQASAAHPELWGMALLAYTFGMRHAFDPDHIAAIDNAVRRMVRRQCHGAGFYFSLGHSTVVLLLVAGLVLSMHWVADKIPQWKQIGSVIGTSVSGGFLLVIGVINLVLWLDLLTRYRRARDSQLIDGDTSVPGGLLARWLKPLFTMARTSGHLFFIGFLFGLGFDTASEVALLALSAGATSSIPWYAVLALPLFFAAGMSLLDTSDGILMIRAYRWAFGKPRKRLFYNLTITGLSVAAALLIGAVEIIQVVVAQLGLKGCFWQAMEEVSFSSLGFVLAGMLLVVWGVSALVGRIGRKGSAAQEGGI